QASRVSAVGLRPGTDGRHSCGSRHPGFRLLACGLAPTVVIPAKAGIQYPDACRVMPCAVSNHGM
ncbi:MAG: hypothetical protein OXU40_09275, partial [Nitrospira sp.]|nr:hypothetical protein [Nitrospira sp.]